MTLTLEINGESKTFQSREFRGIEYLELSQEVNKLSKIKKFDQKNNRNMIKFICKCFGNKFTRKQLSSSIVLTDIVSICVELMGEYERQVLNQTNKQYEIMRR